MDTPTFSASDVELLDKEEAYNGFFSVEKITLRHRLFAGGWSPPLQRELFVRGTAVAAVVYDPKHQLIGLVEQFRIGLLHDANDPQHSQLSPWCIEVVAGMSEPNESPHDVVIRELYEEAGVVPVELHQICEYYTSPGGTSESLTLFCATADLSEAGGIYGLPEECEDIRLTVTPAKKVFDELYGGRYNNAATLICLQWLQANQSQWGY